jgi:4a-hydroxytetrahydrobiopterin dehydratase
MNTGNLSANQCTPYTGGVPPLRGDALEMVRCQLGKDWQAVNEHHLEKEFTFDDFAQALEFTNKVGQLAEQQKHHPDIKLSYGKVLIRLWTRAVNGMTDNDFILAAKIDELE